MKTNNAPIIFLLYSIFFICSEAVEVYKIGTNGKPSWRETSEMRDRSNVPTPSPEDVQTDYRRRSRIPVPVSTNYRSRSSAIPTPSRRDIIADYRRRAKIPIPIASTFRKRFKVSVSPVEKAHSRGGGKTQTRRATNKHSPLQKKNIIDRIFFTIPFGAQFPIYFASRSKKGSSKKSNVALPVHRNRAPFRLQTWGLPINYQTLNNQRYLTPYVENQAIARQHIIPIGDNYMSLAYHRGYRPHPFITSRLLSNRNLVPFSKFRNQANRVPRRLQAFIKERRRRNTGLKSPNKTNAKDADPSRKALITKDRQRVDKNDLQSSKVRDWPQSAVDKEIENILTKLLIVL